MQKLILFIVSLFVSTSVFAWEAKVVDILQHGDVAAISLSPDPGKGDCDVGSPYILIVDETPASQQRFSMLLSALVSGNKIRGYRDPCTTAIWGSSRPTLRRIGLTTKQ